MAFCLALALEWKARQILLGLGPAERRSYPALTQALKWHFGQQTQAFPEQMSDNLASQREGEKASRGRHLIIRAMQLPQV